MIQDVTILIPSYNEEKHIEQAVLSAVIQAEFVIVSDNCSTDNTPKICKNLSKKYKNLIFYEQEENIGSILNFNFLLSKVQTKYVLHIGAHDFISGNYILHLKKALEENSNAVLAYTSLISIDDYNNKLEQTSLEEYKDIFLLSNPTKRVMSIIENYEQYIFVIFGLFRTEVFKKNWTPKVVAGIDLLFLSKCALDGVFVKIDSEFFFRRVVAREENEESYMERIEGKNSSTIYDLSYMCNQQFQLLQKVTEHNKTEQKQVLHKVFLSMARLFGKHSYQSLDQTLAKLLETNEKYILYAIGTEGEYILNKLKEKILFIVDKDSKKHNTIKNGIEIKSPKVLNRYNNKIIISLLGRFDETSNELIQSYDIKSKRLISPIDYSCEIF